MISTNVKADLRFVLNFITVHLSGFGAARATATSGLWLVRTVPAYCSSLTA